jgi:hypothetical protein
MPSPVEVDSINGDTKDEEPTKRMSKSRSLDYSDNSSGNETEVTEL